MRVSGRAVLFLGVLVALVVGSLYITRVILGNDSALANSSVDTQTLRSNRRQWQEPAAKSKAEIVSESERAELIGRAQVWRQPQTPIEQVDFAGDAAPVKHVDCRFRVSALGGTTPKFDCNLESGEWIRVKYGKTGEVHAEVAATRLLRALGFGGDYVSYAERLRCYGCPKEPFSVMKAVEITQAEAIYKKLMLTYDDYEEFAWPAIERKFEGRAIEAQNLAGWALFELDKVSEANHGAPRAHIDALRLFSLFVAHWDNKSENQRLVCQDPEDWDKGQPCRQPFLLLQDVGATFGPAKVDLEAWKKTSIWEDRSTCLTSMSQLPYHGATYGKARISEAGRRFLAEMLVRLSDRQLTDLFTSARFDDALGLFRRSSAVTDWVSVFKARVRQIADGPPCPPLT